uniref:hypothetical protein n=1 Tax=Pseudomonas asturiensis TaxID=1190415 RepID=UPI00046794D9|nr:hypothetical protein [Pseudomonas asturiensis]
MLENYFDCLDVGAQEEVRQLAVDLGWSLQKATQEYLKTAKSLAVVSSVSRMNRKAPVLEIVQGTTPKKGLKRDE